MGTIGCGARWHLLRAKTFHYFLPNAGAIVQVAGRDIFEDQAARLQTGIMAIQAIGADELGAPGGRTGSRQHLRSRRYGGGGCNGRKHQGGDQSMSAFVGPFHDDSLLIAKHSSSECSTWNRSKNHSWRLRTFSRPIDLP